ncbi:hypothetical protein F4808DRAFT_343313 [Astrocystis sublimbata]|nr:hypothetical protein F4808DRAFT_343313 [Astrocystis sublimbata]
MLVFAIILALLIWNAVLTLHILHSWRLLLRVARWSATLYLVVLCLLAAEVLREGLVVNGSDVLHWNVHLAWTLWSVFVVAAALDWRFLFPAAALPLWFVSYPEVRTLLNFGLVRLGWVGLIHSPVAWAASRPKTLEWGIRARFVVNDMLARVVLPILRPVKGLMDHVAGWVLWTTDRSIDKLRPGTQWAWLPFAGRR